MKRPLMQGVLAPRKRTRQAIIASHGSDGYGASAFRPSADSDTGSSSNNNSNSNNGGGGLGTSTTTAGSSSSSNGRGGGHNGCHARRPVVTAADFRQWYSVPHWCSLCVEPLNAPLDHIGKREHISLESIYHESIKVRHRNHSQKSVIMEAVLSPGAAAELRDGKPSLATDGGPTTSATTPPRRTHAEVKGLRQARAAYEREQGICDGAWTLLQPPPLTGRRGEKRRRWRESLGSDLHPPVTPGVVLPNGEAFVYYDERSAWMENYLHCFDRQGPLQRRTELTALMLHLKNTDGCFPFLSDAPLHPNPSTSNAMRSHWLLAASTHGAHVLFKEMFYHLFLIFPQSDAKDISALTQMIAATFNLETVFDLCGFAQLVPAALRDRLRPAPSNGTGRSSSSGSGAGDGLSTLDDAGAPAAASHLAQSRDGSDSGSRGGNGGTSSSSVDSDSSGGADISFYGKGQIVRAMLGCMRWVMEPEAMRGPEALQMVPSGVFSGGVGGSEERLAVTELVEEAAWRLMHEIMFLKLAEYVTRSEAVALSPLGLAESAMYRHISGTGCRTPPAHPFRTADLITFKDLSVPPRRSGANGGEQADGESSTQAGPDAAAASRDQRWPHAHRQGRSASRRRREAEADSYESMLHKEIDREGWEVVWSRFRCPSGRGLGLPSSSSSNDGFGGGGGIHESFGLHNFLTDLEALQRGTESVAPGVSIRRPHERSDGGEENDDHVPGRAAKKKKTNSKNESESGVTVARRLSAKDAPLRQFSSLSSLASAAASSSSSSFLHPTGQATTLSPQEELRNRISSRYRRGTRGSVGLTPSPVTPLPDTWGMSKHCNVRIDARDYGEADAVAANPIFHGIYTGFISPK